jgi:hypothetical protein
MLASMNYNGTFQLPPWPRDWCSISFGNSQYHRTNEMEQWCRDNTGQGSYGGTAPDDVWSVTSNFGTTVFSFKHKHDGVWFALRWANGTVDN